MKRLILAVTAAATLAGPMIATQAEAQPRYDRDRYDRDRDYRSDRDRRHDRDERRSDRYDRDRRDDRGRYDNRYSRNWDDRRYNGYYWNNRWHYGPPPQSYYGNRGLQLGWRNWQRGAYLPPHYRGYAVYDYGRYRLRKPPRGYQWVRVNDDYILAAIATGLILEVIRR